MRITVTGLCLILVSMALHAQHTSDKQANTPAAELYADAPYLCKKTDNQGNPASIPIAFVVHDASAFMATVNLVSINLKFKSVHQNSFSEAISFNSMSDNEFYQNFALKSTVNTSLSIQQFDTACVSKHAQHTFKFLCNSNILNPSVTYEKIDKTWWYFVYEIPYSYIAPYGDTLDIEIHFEQNLATDDYIYLRVIRSDDVVPSLAGWYRGDTHFHSMFTQNTAELGLPVEITPIMATHLGMDWTALTDHSCDYDNYGSSMHNNWLQQRTLTQQMNSDNNDFKTIHGIEMSVNNSQGKTVHCLSYPSPASPYSMPYFGDGDGDVSQTDVSIDMLLDSLVLYGGFAYAAHPFAEGDALSVVVNGGAWNLGHPGFTPNGEPHSYAGTVICNNIETASDVYVSDQNHFKPRLRGFQILNMRNRLSVANELDNPWGPFNNGDDMFQPLPLSDPLHYQLRYNQNREVYDFMLQQGLADAEIDGEFRKIYQIAGSDAHGSFNYSNTDFTMGIYGNVNDNAFGKFSTLVYCPQGMGEDGEEILNALHNGRAILSEGPIVEIALLNTVDNSTVLIGEDTEIDYSDLSDWQLTYQWASSGLYGEADEIILIIGNKDVWVETELGLWEDNIDLHQLISQCLGSNYQQGNIVLMAELITYKEPASQYDHISGYFHAYTNPIWIRIHNNTINPLIAYNGFLLYPNPAADIISLSIDSNSDDEVEVSIYSITDDLVYKGRHKRSNPKINIGNLKNGVYTVNMRSKRAIKKQKLIVQR